MTQNASIDKKNLEIIKQLGTGSYGTVHLVKKHNDDKLYALKSVKLNTMNHNDKSNALNEIRLLASIQSPYVIRYQTAFFDQNSSTLCIMMQYAQEGDLSAIISDLKEKRSTQEDPIGFEQCHILETAFGLLQGLKALHQKKIVHRDLKSANVFFSHGIPKIGDLNVSKVISNELCSTQTGTPYYTCPEVWKGTPYDQKCDIWSLGVLLYQMCCLCFPFCARQFPMLLRKIIKGQYKPISQKYSQSMSNLIKLCLTIQPSQRPSAQQLLKLEMFTVLHKKYKAYLSMNGNIKLMQSIKLPRIMTLLDRKLKKIDQQRVNSRKKVTFTGKIKGQNEQFTSKCNIFKISKKQSMKKIKSQKLIHMIPTENKQNNTTLTNMQQIRGSIAQIFGKNIYKMRTNKIKAIKSQHLVNNHSDEQEQTSFREK